MVTIAPLVPNSLWMAGYFKALALGLNTTDAITEANRSLNSLKDFGRYSLRSPKGETIVLSLAVEGGGRQLRVINKIETLRLSEHGNWRKNHLGAIEACLGRTPFFPYISPKLSEIYLNKELQTLSDFNTAIFELLLSFISKDLPEKTFSLYYNDITLKERGREIVEKIKPEISSLETIFTFGKESLLGFLAL